MLTLGHGDQPTHSPSSHDTEDRTVSDHQDRHRHLPNGLTMAEGRWLRLGGALNVSLHETDRTSADLGQTGDKGGPSPRYLHANKEEEW